MDQSNNQNQKTRARLPDEVRREFSLFETYEKEKKILTDLKLPVEKIARLDEKIFWLLEGRISPEAFLTQLASVFKISEQQAVVVAQKITKELLLPMQEKIPEIDLQAFLNVWKQDENKPTDPHEFVHTYVEEFPDQKDERSTERLEKVLVDVAEGDLTHEQATDQLAKSKKIGGLGIDPSLAESMVETFEKKIEGKVFVDDQAKTESVSKPTQSQKPQIETFTEEDEKEIERIKKEREEVLAHEPIKSVEDVVNVVCEHKNFQFDDPVLTERCQKLVRSRVRGVRDAFGARRQLERAVDQGGLGVKGRQLADMTQQLEQAVEEYHAHAGKKIEEEKAQDRQKKEEQLQAEEDRQMKDRKVMDKRFVELTGKTPKTSLTPAAPKRTRTSAAISAHIETQQREGRIDVERVKSAIEGSRQSVSPSHSKPKKPTRVQDVVFEKRLAGPAEELQRMTLTDFRRLSSDPVQAITKIKDKIDLLENTGYEQRVEGIKAWRSSPLNRLYIALTEEAVLSGTTIQEIIETKQKEEGDMLNYEELKAIMKLNADLRF
jgi:hypothetical protein